MEQLPIPEKGTAMKNTGAACTMSWIRNCARTNYR